MTNIISSKNVWADRTARGGNYHQAHDPLHWRKIIDKLDLLIKVTSLSLKYDSLVSSSPDCNHHKSPFSLFAWLYTFGLTGMLNGPSQHGFNYLVTKNQRRLFRTDGQVKLQFNIFARWWWGTRSGLKHNLIYIYKSCSVPNTERGYNSTYSTIIETFFQKYEWVM